MEFENFSMDLLKRATGTNVNAELILGRLDRTTQPRRHTLRRSTFTR